MDSKSKASSMIPSDATVPEEDARLLAIEALEARAIDPDPAPFNAPRSISVPPRSTPPSAPKVTTPVPPSVPETTATTLKDVIATKPVAVKPIPEPPRPKKPVTISEAITEELAHAPATKGFQFFTNHSIPRARFIAISIIVVIIGLSAGAYFVLR